MVFLARCAMGKTQTEFSKLISIPQSRLSRIEDGLVSEDSPDFLAKLSAATGNPPGFFTQQGDRKPLREGFYRRKKAVSKSDIWRAEALINIRRLQLQHLAGKLDWDTKQLPQWEPDQFQGGPAEVARQLRFAMQLPSGPIGDLTKIVEDYGVVVSYFDFGIDDVDGISTVLDGGIPLILLNKNKPAARLRFTLAHELGHLVMHRLPTPNMEEEAHEFAAEFLLPAREIRASLYPLNISKLVQLKLKWRVSMQAILMTARRLGVMKDPYYRYMMVQLSQAGYRRNEPYDESIPKEQPSLVGEMIETHFKDLGYSPEELAKIMRMEPDAFEREYRNSDGATFRVIK